MISSMMLSGILLFWGQTFDFPNIWKKVEGKWSYVGASKGKKANSCLDRKDTKNCKELRYLLER